MLSFWRKRDDADFERVLEEIDQSITLRESRLAEIKEREQRAVVRFTIYGLSLWALYLAIWWTGALGREDVDVWQKVTTVVPIIALPIFIVLCRRSLSWWYKRSKEREQAALKVLRTKQREEVNRLKKKTKYDETRSLLERYDEKSRRLSEAGKFGTSSPARSVGTDSPANPQVRQRRGPTGQPLSALASAQGTPIKAGTNGAPFSNSQTLSPQPYTPSRGWADRFANALLGDDENATSKYALVCQQCRQHNGLVLRDELYTLQYVCPRCGHLNPPKPRPEGEEISRHRTMSASGTSRPRVRHSVAGVTSLEGQYIRPHSIHEVPSPVKNVNSLEGPGGKLYSFPKLGSERDREEGSESGSDESSGGSESKSPIEGNGGHDDMDTS